MICSSLNWLFFIRSALSFLFYQQNSIFQMSILRGAGQFCRSSPHEVIGQVHHDSIRHGQSGYVHIACLNEPVLSIPSIGPHRVIGQVPVGVVLKHLCLWCHQQVPAIGHVCCAEHSDVHHAKPSHIRLPHRQCTMVILAFASQMPMFE